MRSGGEDSKYMGVFLGGDVREALDQRELVDDLAA